MNITFKKCISENNRLNKQFADVGTSFIFDFKSESSVFNPIVLIATSENLTQYNYAEIPEFNRKYFITDIVVVRTGLYQLTLHVDVLSTYANELVNIPIIAARNQNRYNMYLNDPEFNILSYDDIEVKTFPSTGFTKDLSFVLAVSG